MPRETLDRQMQKLQDEVLLMGSMIEQAMSDAIDALNRRDTVAARCVYDGDQFVNEKRFAIENAVLILMATQQPMAHDLRFLAAILEVITEMERMGDYAKGIARVTIRLQDENVTLPMREFTRMAELAISMLHDALSAFIREDTQLALDIVPRDSEVDDLYNKVYHKLVTDMIANPDSIDRTNLLMWVCHDLERMADRVINICERTVFISTGELLELASSDEEDKDALK
jgi:phosphate transport system protein